MRVRHVPRATTSRGTTRIYNEGELVPHGGRPAPAPAKRESTHIFNGVSYGVVYANERARAPFERPEPTTFPVGSVIVREKL
ncbi:MAG TPA: hypothetical protein VF508_05525, partial [Pyrinomonadaceae bacterium]